MKESLKSNHSLTALNLSGNDIRMVTVIEMMNT